MNTSYFAVYRGDNGVNIALYKPRWYSGISYPKLAPTPDILKKYKKDLNVEEYIVAYQRDVLDKLRPDEVYDQLFDKTLLCYETSNSFCHRHLVARWLENNLGVCVLELTIIEARTVKI